MAELDDRLRRDLARLRQRSSPPPGAEQRVRAALDAALGPGPGGDGDGGSTVDGLGSGGLGGSGKLALAAKVVAATAAAAAVGVLVLELGVMPAKQPGESVTTPVELATPNTSRDPPRSTAQSPPEPPIVVTPPVEPPSRMRRPTAPDEDQLGAEVALLEQAREADNPTARLGLLEQHRQRFPAGLLAAERESLRISTLCELDRLDAAREAAEEFLRAHPRSPLRLRMRSACPNLDILAD